MRALKIAGKAIAAIMVIAVLLLVIGVPTGFLTSEIQARVERETGYRLTIGGTTRIGIWPTLNVTFNDITLQRREDNAGTNRLTAASIEADITLASIWSGRPEVSELKIDRPVLSVPLRREAAAGAPPASNTPASRETDAPAPVIGRVVVSDGIVVFSNPRDRIEKRIEAINVAIDVSADRQIAASGTARSGGDPLKFAIHATAPAPPLARQNIPTELTLEMPALLQAPLTAKAEIRLNGSTVMINGVSGTLGEAAFNGWASAELSSKPLVKLDLDFQRLSFAKSARGGSSGDTDIAAPWSNATLDLSGLNYVDVRAHISAAELNIGEARMAPAETEATLSGGVLKAKIANLGAYGGQANGDLSIDVSASTPTYTLRSDLTGISALPLLRGLASFDKLDGRMQAKIAVRSAGNSQRAILSGLDGAVFVVFQDGAIRGLNVAQMIRQLTSGTLSGWQDGREQATDLTQLSASFRIEKGQATTADLNLVGPLVKMTGAGTIDLGAKTLSLRVEPKLVMTTEGQGRTSEPVGLGIPVAIEGPWAQPRIYPDLQGILDNPDAAYATLRQMGKGLFGGSGGGAPAGGLLGGLGNLGNLGGGNLGGGTGNRTPPGNTPGNGNDPLGGDLGATLGTLLQGLGQVTRPPNGAPPTLGSAQPNAPTPASPPPQGTADTRPQADNPAMNDVLKQLFNR